MNKCYFLLFVLLFFVFSCIIKQSNKDLIIGHWRVQSKFYAASYQIVENNGRFNAIVLYYNDGTTKYKYDGKQTRYAFTNLTQEGQMFVDGISGATTKQTEQQNIAISSKHQDTLAVTTWIMNKPLTEIWVRQNTK